MKNISNFEKDIQRTYNLPDVNPGFMTKLEKNFTGVQKYERSEQKPNHFRFSMGWAVVLITLIAVTVLFLAIGPSQVLAQIQSLLGYVPGVGVVDTSAPFYELSEPVSDTRDDITLIIQSALLSEDQIIISFTITDLPEEMTPKNFYDPKCITPAYLVLPDDSAIQSLRHRSSITPDGGYEHNLFFKIPSAANFTRATLIFPCLQGTVPGTGPTNWQFDLTFEPAPDDLTVFPVALMDQSETEAEENPVDASGEIDSESIETVMPAMIVDGDRQEEMALLSVVEKPDSYWITWGVPFAGDPDIQVNGHLYLMPYNPVLYDANGVELPESNQTLRNELWDYTNSVLRQLPEEDQLKYFGSSVTFAVPKTGVDFPVYLKLNVLERSFPEKESYAEIKFNGTHVQNTDEPVMINQEINIGSVAFTLDSIERGEFGEYSFNFNGEESSVVQCKVEVLGLSPIMSGEGTRYPGDLFNFFESLLFSSAPVGQRTLRISEPAVLGDMISFIGTWSPDN